MVPEPKLTVVLRSLGVSGAPKRHNFVRYHQTRRRQVRRLKKINLLNADVTGSVTSSTEIHSKVREPFLIALCILRPISPVANVKNSGCGYIGNKFHLW